MILCFKFVSREKKATLQTENFPKHWSFFTFYGGEGINESTYYRGNHFITYPFSTRNSKKILRGVGYKKVKYCPYGLIPTGFSDIGQDTKDKLP
jgi:hypothetical protein